MNTLGTLRRVLLAYNVAQQQSLQSILDPEPEALKTETYSEKEQNQTSEKKKKSNTDSLTLIP